MLFKQFNNNWKENFATISTTHAHFFIAVSGGIDSCVLLHLMHQYKTLFTILHCNFNLRGEESIRDEKFVIAIAEKYNAPILVKHFDTKNFAEENKLSIQEAARKLRYNWFSEILNSSNNIQKYLVTAHNADDNIETVLMNVFRGTGIKGLTGIPLFDNENKIIRPLLFALRDDIVVYATKNKLTWVEDSSNTEDNYTRNFFRHQIIPLVEQKFSNAKENVLHNIIKWNDVEAIYTNQLNQYKKKLLVKDKAEYKIPILLLKKMVAYKTVLWELIKSFGFAATQLQDVVCLLDADNGSFVQAKQYRIFKNRKWLVIATMQTNVAQQILIENADKNIVFDKGTLHFKTMAAQEFSITSNTSIALLDAEQITYPLLLRKWKQGDYFYPLGMKKKKKLSRFFIDQKLSATEKENVWVIEMDKKIIWIVNYRIDERFKIKANTNNVLKIECC
ncbi:MAG: tRNA lysidine(34) synthetase TilS [Bacteroidetes bacterium]|nr:tRNA lysidine(34) synthetase TilS [Bacteroidota bacterium]MBS1650234.1 tRNA lysidine(34) synthetase TilS [Bacteroidota bacterium]